jgi:23S rRNA pseudouridine1911/1915/1917 synthase
MSCYRVLSYQGFGWFKKAAQAPPISLARTQTNLRFSSSSSLPSQDLLPPTILYSDNHILVVNKPVGWHSVPNPEESPKCLLSELKRNQWGGGSAKDFLLPLHRIDQPCSGVLMLAKTSKAASRITSLWKQKRVKKEYLCVVSTSRLPRLQQVSNTTTVAVPSENNNDNDSNDWQVLKGVMQPRLLKTERSVVIRPPSLKSTGRPVDLSWKLINNKKETSDENNNDDYSMILVQTNSGARHMVRALLTQIGGCPIVGDVRYDATSLTLKDQSVALHAYRVMLDDRLQLGSLDTFEFQAPIPATWNTFFGLSSSETVL